MANLRDIRKRIKSIENTSKVTHAMELVAAAKMRKSQESALASRPYTIALNQIISELRSKTKEDSHALLKKKTADSDLLILLTTDRGLVGGLNINLFREITGPHRLTAQRLAGEAKETVPSKTKVIVVGKKGLNFAAKSNFDIIASFNSDEFSLIELTRTLTKLATENFTSGQVSSVKILYPDFESTVKQIPTFAQILPLTLPQPETVAEVEKDIGFLLFEPNANRILENILPHYVLTKIYQTLLEAKASEHSARMVSMKNATDAAKDLVDDLTLTYNQARQEAITKELLDIITAQSAFN